MKNICRPLIVLALALPAWIAPAMAQTPNQVQTKGNLSLYYWIYPTTTPGVTLPGTVPTPEGQSGVAVAVQSTDSTVVAFVVTLNYVASDGSSQSAVHRFASAASGFATELFPVGTVQSVGTIAVIPVVASQEVLFNQPPSTDGSRRTAPPTQSRRQ